MAEFCKTCSIETFGEDFGDFADKGMGDDEVKAVLCEGCPDPDYLTFYIIVDKNGERVTDMSRFPAA